MPDRKASRRTEKKSETIEARLPLTLKRDFTARCEAEGKSASEVLRKCIEDYLASPDNTRDGARAMTNTRILKYAASVAALAGVAAVAHHGALAQSHDAHFAAADSNGDGALSEAELLAAHGPGAGHAQHGAEAMAALHGGGAADWHRQLIAAEFTAAAGADGKLSRQEMDGFHRRVRDGAFAALDTSGDGAVDAAELRRVFGDKAGDALRHADADSDGRITRAEFAAMHARH